MAALIWDNKAQAFREVNTPRRYDPTLDAWVETTGRKWDTQAQAWREVWGPKPQILYLIKDGILNNGQDIKSFGVTSSDWMSGTPAAPVVSYNDAYISFAMTVSNGEGVSRFDALDFTTYKTLHIDYAARSGAYQSVQIGYAISAVPQTDYVTALSMLCGSGDGRAHTVSRQTGTIDINLSGNCYPCIYFISGPDNYINIYNLWLE